jgi:hypothetical protein
MSFVLQNKQLIPIHLKKHNYPPSEPFYHLYMALCSNDFPVSKSNVFASTEFYVMPLLRRVALRECPKGVVDLAKLYDLIGGYLWAYVWPIRSEKSVLILLNRSRPQLELIIQIW